MKKLVLAMVFILLMALFIAFNYLLWDRENRVKELEDLKLANADNSVNMSLQGREIKNLEEENNTLQLKVNQLESEKEQLTASKNNLSSEKDQLNSIISGKNDLLNALKQISDLKELEKPVEKWVDAINTGDYSTAYGLEYKSLATGGNPPGITVYSENLKNNIKSISLKSVKLDTSRGTDNGEIVLNAELEVRLPEKADSQTWKDGLNEKFIQIGYDTTVKQFIILQIF